MIGMESAIAIVAVIAAVLLIAALTPIETMTWWAGWSPEDLDDPPPHHARAAPPAAAYAVYLSGVNAISGDALTRAELRLLRRIAAAAPGLRIVADVFPYAPSGRALIGHTRAFERLWAFLINIKIRGARRLAQIINLRNIFQVLVSADARYGPIYNFGVAGNIEEALEREGYVEGCGAPVFLIGFSGGGQIAAGVVGYLWRRLKAPVVIVTIGGVFASSPGLERAAAAHCLVGGKDATAPLGALFFPQRWTAFASSPWNRLRQEGRVFVHRLPGVRHNGPRGYYGPMRCESHASNFDRTSDAVVGIIRAELHQRAAGRAAAAPPAASSPLDGEFASR